jgi:KDO2-lipid IV(A) lauroyltransferase
MRPIHRLIIRLGNLHRRMLTAALGALGWRFTYALMAFAGDLIYALLPPLRARSVAHCRAALGDRLSSDAVMRTARMSFIHRLWGLADLMLAERLLHPGTYRRYGGRVPDPHRAALRDAQRRGQPAILLTAYYGSYDLLPLFLGFNGIQAGIVYRRHENAGYDAFRRRVRARGGCELIEVARALARVPRLLQAGRTVALVADHHAERGLPVTFLGLPTTALRSVGTLACRYDADVVVAGLRRVGRAFHFAVEIVDVIPHADWSDEPDPVRYVTTRYLRALETLIRRDPTQYPWAYARWGETLARQLTAAESTPLG